MLSCGGLNKFLNKKSKMDNFNSLKIADNNPKVSIGMPVYNGQQYIRRALDSLLVQDYDNFELNISDNASTDLTQRICAEYAERDQRIKYYRNSINVGSNKNFARVFALSQGEYFMWASCHDLWERTFISRCMEVLKHESNVVLCCSLADYIDLNGNSLVVIPRMPDTRGFGLLSRCHVVMWGLQYAYPIYGLIRTEALKQTKMFRTVVGSDIVLLFELSLLGEFAQIPEALLHLRRVSEFDSWDNYIERCLNKPIKGLSCRLLFWGMVFEHQRAVASHIRGMFLRLGLMFSVLVCMLLKYHRVLLGLMKRR